MTLLNESCFIIWSSEVTLELEKILLLKVIKIRAWTKSFIPKISDHLRLC